MRLQNLRPKEGATLIQLQKLMDGQGGRAALPDAMPDDFLLRLAYDFRAVEKSLCGPPETTYGYVPSMEPAVYLVMKLLLQHPARIASAQAMTVSDVAMMRLLQMYQWGLEREVVSRIVGLTSGQQTESLLDGMWRCAYE